MMLTVTMGIWSSFVPLNGVDYLGHDCRLAASPVVGRGTLIRCDDVLSARVPVENLQS